MAMRLSRHGDPDQGERQADPRRSHSEAPAACRVEQMQPLGVRRDRQTIARGDPRRAVETDGERRAAASDLPVHDGVGAQGLDQGDLDVQPGRGRAGERQMLGGEGRG
jgi:hypothetical protein